MRHRPLILCALLALSACGAPSPQTHNADAEDADLALRQRVESYYATMSARDWDAYRDFFWPEATLTTIWQPPNESGERVVVTSIDEFLANTAHGPDSQPIFEEKLLSQDVRITNELAGVWARYEARFGDSTSVMTWRGVDAFTWMKHDGTWRIVALAYIDVEDEASDAP